MDFILIHIIGNIEVIKCMVEKSKHIDILVGGGLNFTNIKGVMEKCKAAQYHFGTSVRYNNSAFCEIDVDRLRELVNIISKGEYNP